MKPPLLIKLVIGILCITYVVSCKMSSSDHSKSRNRSNKEGYTSGLNSETLLPPDDYIKWIKTADNGLFVSKEVGDITYSIQYEPLEYVALRNLKTKSVSKEQLKNETDRLSDLQYYTLKISTSKGTDILKYGAEGQYEFNQRIDYYSFRMQSDLKLVEESDTLPCVLFHFERTYGISPYSCFVLAFELTVGEKAGVSEGKKYRHKDKQFIFYDQTLKNGIIKLKLRGNNLDQLPILKTSS